MPTNDLDPKDVINVNGLITRMLELYDNLNQQKMSLDELMGENCPFLMEELQELHDLILDASGVTARRKVYQQQLVNLGAPCMSWKCLEAPSQLLFDFVMEGEFDAEEVLNLLTIYIQVKGVFPENNADLVAQAWAEATANPQAEYHKLTMECDF